MDEVLSLIGGFIGAIVSILAISNRVNDRFSRLEVSLQELRGRLDVHDALIRDLKESIEYFQNGTKEQIQHARSRIEDYINRVDSNHTFSIRVLRKHVDDVSGFLTKTTDFNSRKYD